MTQVHKAWECDGGGGGGGQTAPDVCDVINECPLTSELVIYTNNKCCVVMKLTVLLLIIDKNTQAKASQ